MNIEIEIDLLIELMVSEIEIQMTAEDTKCVLVVEGVGVSHVASLGGRGDAVGGQQEVAALHTDRPVRA